MKYNVFNKMTKGFHGADDLSLMYDAFKLVSVLAALAEHGRYEDEYNVVTPSENIWVQTL